jgi:hypothetical protein
VEAKVTTCQRRDRAARWKDCLIAVAQEKKAVSKDIAITARERIIDTIKIKSGHPGVIGIRHPVVIGILPTRMAAAAHLVLSTAVMPLLKTTQHKW